MNQTIVNHAVTPAEYEDLKASLLEGVGNALAKVGALYSLRGVKKVKEHPYFRGAALEATADVQFRGARVWVTVAFELGGYGPRGSHGVVWGRRYRYASHTSYAGTYYYEAAPDALRYGLNAESDSFFSDK